MGALLGRAAAAVEADPASVDVYNVALLHAAAVLTPEAKLPAAVRAGRGGAGTLCVYVCVRVRVCLRP